jgi:hypothetical protein
MSECLAQVEGKVRHYKILVGIPEEKSSGRSKLG